MTKEQYDLAQAYKRCFTETADGKAILEDLKKGYCVHTTFHVEPIAMGFLEGHRDVVLRIEHLIEAASKRIEDILDDKEEDNAGEHSEYFEPKQPERPGHYI